MKTSSDHHPIPAAKGQRLDPTEIQRHRLKNILLIYAGDSLEENNDAVQNKIAELRSRIHDVKLFNNVDECVQCLNQLKTEKVIAVMSGTITKVLLPIIDSLPQVYAIHLIDEQANNAGIWLKVKDVHSDILSVFKSIEKDIERYQDDDVPITFMSTEKDRLNPSFMYTRLFLQTLLRMKDDKRQLEEFASFFGTKHADNKVTLEVIKRFPDTYRSEDAIKLYSKHSFMYEEVNTACRLLEGDSIVHMGFFIRDLCNRIKELHEKQISQWKDKTFHLYRGQGMSIGDLEKLNSETGQLIAFNGFLSTSEDEDVARTYAESNSSHPNKVGILFDITIDPKIQSVVFANIQAQTQHPEEEEYLFSMHSVFRRGDIKPLNENGEKVYRVELTLTDDDDPELHHLTDHMALELSSVSDDEKLRVLIVRIGQDKSAEEHYRASLIRDIPWSEKARCYQELGVIKRDQGLYAEAFAYLRKSEVILKRISPDECTIKNLYQGIGGIYTLIGKHSDALTYYKRSLDICERHGSSHDCTMALYYNSIAITFYQMKKNSDALFYFEKALSIMKLHYSDNHPCLAKVYLNISAVKSGMENHSEALTDGENALKILENALPNDHEWLAEAHHNVGVTHSAMGDTDKALVHYEQVLRISERRGSLNSRILGTTYNSIGMIYLKKENYDAALSKFNDAVKIFQSMLPTEDNTVLATIYINVGDTYFDMGEYTRASSFYEKALPMFNKTIPDGFDGLFNVYTRLGASYMMMEDYQKSIDYCKAALDNIQKTQPDNHQALVDVYIVMGNIYHEMGNCTEQFLCFIEALDIQRRHNLPPHSGLAEFTDLLIPLAIDLVKQALSPSHQ